MDEHEGNDLRVAFEEILVASAEPALPSVTDVALAGGRRIRRRRRVAVAAAGVLAVAALTVTTAIGLPGTGPDRHPLPQAPASSPPPTTPAQPPPTRAHWPSATTTVPMLAPTPTR